MRRTGSALLGGVVALAVLPGAAAAPAALPTASRVVVVDDAGVACVGGGSTPHRTVQAGVDAAEPGDRVVVCPGEYREQVVLDEEVTLQGPVGAVDAADCLDPAPAGARPDPTSFAVLAPPDEDPEVPLLRVRADGVEVAGMVFWGHGDAIPDPLSPAEYPQYDAAVQVDGAVGGLRLHHDLFSDNGLAIELGGSGSAQNRVDHSCFRDNDWAVANQRFPLRDGRIDDNTTFRTRVLTFELGWGYAPVTDVRLDHNVSHDPGFAVAWVVNGRQVVVEGNLIRASGRGVHVGGGTTDVRVTSNDIGAPAGGEGNVGVIAVATPGLAPTTGLVVEGNTVHDLRGAPGTGMVFAPSTLPSGAVVAQNTVTANRSEGIRVGGGNVSLRVTANVVTGNGTTGIRVLAGTGGSLFVDNTALGNHLDAQDLSLTTPTPDPNQWIRTTCVTDDPVGAICAPPVAGG
jgi:nitrous oxidase accessory protein NosD